MERIVSDLFNSIQSLLANGNKSQTQSGVIEKITRAYGLLGFVRLLNGFYMIFVRFNKVK
jgi:hypothetical protein